MYVFNYVVGFCSILSLFVAHRSDRRVKKKKLKCESSLKLNKALALIKVTNFGVPNITVEKIELSLVVWDSSPWFQLTGFELVLQVIERIRNYHRDQIYVSKSKINYPFNSNFPLTLEGSQPIEVSIDLIETIDNFFNNCEHHHKKNSVWLMFRSLTIDVVCTHKTYKFRPHREVRAYIWSRYRYWVSNN